MDHTITFDELKELIARIYPGMSKQLQRIATYALKHPDELALGTVAAVAQATQVQPSAVIRFANALGFGGFSEVQQVYRGHLLERSDNYRERINELRRKNTDGLRGAPTVLHQLVSDSVADLGHLEQNILASDMKAAIRLIATKARIHLLAQRRAFPIAAYLGYALSRLDLRTHLLDGAGGMLRESLRSISAGDVLIVASFRHYSPEVIDATINGQELGASIIAITDGPLSPLKAPATVCFELPDDSSQAFRSLVAPLCLAQALVVGAGHYLVERKTTKPGRVSPRPKRS